MKRLLSLFLSVLGCYMVVSAQRPSFKPQTHQLEVQLGTLHKLVPGSDAVYLEAQPFAFNYVNGFRYTYHYSLTHGFRAGVQYLSATYDPDPGVVTQFRFYAPVSSWEYNLGYVYKFHIKRSQLFFATDLLYGRSRLSVKSDQLPDQDQVSGPFQSIGGRAGIGYRYFFSPYLSLAVEAYGKYTNRFDQQASPEPDYSFFQPTQLSWNTMATLSLHLVKMKKRCTCPSVGKTRYR